MPRIGIGEKQPVSMRLLRAFVDSVWFTRPALRQVVPQAQHKKSSAAWMCLGDFLQHARCGIRRAIVYDNYLQVLVVLLKQRSDAAPDIALLITSWHDDRNQGATFGLHRSFRL